MLNTDFEAITMPHVRIIVMKILEQNIAMNAVFTCFFFLTLVLKNMLD